MRNVLPELVDNGFLDKELIRRDIETLITQLIIMGRNWSTESQIYFQSLSWALRIEYNTNLMVKVLRPYFTAKGEKNAVSIYY